MSNDSKKVKVEVNKGNVNQEVKVNVNSDDKKKPNIFGQLSAGCLLMIFGGCGLGCAVLIIAMLASGTAIAAAIKYLW